MFADRTHPIKIIALVILVCGFSFTLTILASLGELQLDEIWSLGFAREASSVFDIFLNYKIDNNHVLNTLFLYYVKGQEEFYVYRIFSVAFGFGVILLLGYSAFREWGVREAVCSIILSGTSFPLILYFSEGRGYSSAMFFSILAYVVLRLNSIHFKWYRVLLYWAAFVLALLSHSTFGIVAIALLAFNLAHVVTENKARGRNIPGLFIQQFPPFVLFAGWYYFHISGMEIGGGPVPDGLLDVLTETTSVLLGMPENQYVYPATLLIFVFVIAAGIFYLVRDGNTSWTFYLTVLVLSPALMLVITKPVYLYFRYFIVCFPFFYLLLSYLICRAYKKYYKPYYMLILLIVVFMVYGHLKNVSSLIVSGRGSYTHALSYIQENTPGPIVRIASDQDFRSSTLLEFYAPRVFKEKSLRYIKQSMWSKERPDWFISDSTVLVSKPAYRYVLAQTGPAYRLVGQYGHSGYSGLYWYLYRREE